MRARWRPRGRAAPEKGASARPRTAGTAPGPSARRLLDELKYLDIKISARPAGGKGRLINRSWRTRGQVRGTAGSAGTTTRGSHGGQRQAGATRAARATRHAQARLPG